MKEATETAESRERVKRKRMLIDLTRDELRAAFEAGGNPKYRADQMFGWIHAKGVLSPDEWTNVPKSVKEFVDETFDTHMPSIVTTIESADGSVKMGVKLASGHVVESVVMPSRYGTTLCASTQSGCALRCVFCQTGRLGLARSLSAGEIALQVHLAAKLAGRKITNVVYMGMGEPLANIRPVIDSIRLLSSPGGLEMSERRITISTIGFAKAIRHLAASGVKPDMALSLHFTDDSRRGKFLPATENEPIAKVLKAVEEYREATNAKVTFEYMLLAGVNDRVADARNLASLARAHHVHVNLFAYNPVAGALSPIDGSELKRPTHERMVWFESKVKEAGASATLRMSRGLDVSAACGMLGTGLATSGRGPGSARS